MVKMAMTIVLGGFLGLDRGYKNRPAGFRTYILVCLGAAITMMIGLYELSYYAPFVKSIDISRIGAQVINGIGFLGAGTIMVDNHQSVSGLTTASGLWATACMGLAIGSGAYLCAVLGFTVIMISFRFFSPLERKISELSRNMSVYIEFRQISDLHYIIRLFGDHNIEITDIELMDRKESLSNKPAVTLSLILKNHQQHGEIISALSDEACILHLEETC